jgi:hypothetical protein
LEKFESLLQKAQQLKKPEIEKNIFSIGGRGHYENPISDILAFFINPNEDHGFGSLFLKSVFESANVEIPLLEIVKAPKREVSTDSGNRIDLLVEGDEWVLTIENKIRHEAVNPFDDYTDYIDKHHKKKPSKLFLLLSIRYETPPDGWIGITYNDLISKIKDNIGSYFTSSSFNKWHIILREFILNIENQYRNEGMDADRFYFIKDNYQTIQDIAIMVNEYIEHMKKMGVEALSSVSDKNDIAYARQNDWGDDGIALRLISSEWDDKSNITLLLRKEGTFTIQFYVYDIPDDQVEKLKGYIDTEKFKKFWTESQTIRCFGFFNSDDEKIIFEEIRMVAKRLNEFYSNLRK